MFLPNHVMAQACGPFVDVPATDVFCPFILQAFIDSVTQGTSATTFSPNDLLPRNQVVTFFDRVMDQSLHRGNVRTAIGKAWSPSSTNGGVATDVGAQVNDVVTDGTFLWLARNDSKILKVNAADRRLIETWTIPAGSPRKLGVFAGQVWIADNLGNLFAFNPSGTPGAATQIFSASAGITGGFPTLSFDGTNVWWASSTGPNMFIYPAGSSGGFSFNIGGNVDSTVFDGTNMWVLLASSTLLKLAIPTAAAPVPSAAETLVIPGPVNDCRILYDGNNIWLPMGNGILYVVRPTVPGASFASSIVKNEAIPDVGFPYVASFDGENVMIGGVNNGTVALYRATNLARIRTFVTGALSVRGIASDGKTFNVGDALGTKFFQF